MSVVKARLKQDDLYVFDWDLTDGDQGNLDTNDGIQSTPVDAKEFSKT